MKGYHAKIYITEILQIKEVSENEFNLWKKPENHYMGRIA